MSGWQVSEKYISMLRQLRRSLHGLRLRFRTFWGDVLICLLLCVAFVIHVLTPIMVIYDRWAT
jgi:hypothetical protein